MEESRIFDLIDVSLLQKWREKIEEDEKESYFFKNESEVKTDVKSKLNDNGKTLIDDYSIALQNKMDYLYYNLMIKIMNYGIKIGIELQAAFEKYE